MIDQALGRRADQPVKEGPVPRFPDHHQVCILRFINGRNNIFKGNDIICRKPAVLVQRHHLPEPVFCFGFQVINGIVNKGGRYHRVYHRQGYNMQVSELMRSDAGQ
ncbi:hypothetical protein D9M68_985310 [compost metagenome]